MPHRSSPSAAAFHQKAMQNYKNFPTLPNIPLNSYFLSDWVSDLSDWSDKSDLSDWSDFSGSMFVSGFTCGFFLAGMVHTAETVKPNLESPP